MIDAIGRDANAGVGHAAFQHQLLRIILAAGKMHGDFAARRKFDCIRQQIQQYLPKPRCVAQDIKRHVVAHVEQQRQAFFARIFGDQFERIFDHRYDFHRYRFERHTTRLDLRKIQHIVDQSQQRIAGRADQPDVIMLLVVQASFGEQAGHAQNTV